MPAITAIPTVLFDTGFGRALTLRLGLLGRRRLAGLPPSLRDVLGAGGG
jgi:hypothetical protein